MKSTGESLTPCLSSISLVLVSIGFPRSSSLASRNGDFKKWDGRCNGEQVPSGNVILTNVPPGRVTVTLLSQMKTCDQGAEEYGPSGYVKKQTGQ